MVPFGDGTYDTARTAREAAEAELAELQTRIAPRERQINQLGREFWVPKDQVVAQNYDLPASRTARLNRMRSSMRNPR